MLIWTRDQTWTSCCLDQCTTIMLSTYKYLNTLKSLSWLLVQEIKSSADDISAICASWDELIELLYIEYSLSYYSNDAKILFLGPGFDPWFRLNIFFPEFQKLILFWEFCDFLKLRVHHLFWWMRLSSKFIKLIKSKDFPLFFFYLFFTEIIRKFIHFLKTFSLFLFVNIKVSICCVVIFFV